MVQLADIGMLVELAYRHGYEAAAATTGAGPAFVSGREAMRRYGKGVVRRCRPVQDGAGKRLRYSLEDLNKAAMTSALTEVLTK